LLERRIGYTSFKELTEIDQHEKGKIGSFSIMLPYSERTATVEAYWQQRFNADMDCFTSAVQSVKYLIQFRSLRPTSFSTAYNQMPEGTSLGAPWFTSDKRYASDYLDRAERVRSPDDINPCVLYWRGQAKGLHEIPKQRVVWGFDHAETILGATILYPCLTALSKLHGFSAWLGDVYVDEAMTRLLSKADGRRIISMDFSGFDSSLHRHLLDAVDDILASWFTGMGPGRVKLLGIISDTVQLIVPGEILGGRTGGMPSGSVLTNLRDTIANLIAGFYVAYRNRTTLIDYELLGDDSVYLWEEDLSPEAVASSVAELGLESNPDKQFVSARSAHFLQRWHSLDYKVNGVCRGVRSPFRALSGMLSYERFKRDWSKYMDTSRWIMQVENVKWDPRFELFVRFLKDGDELLNSGMDPKDIFRKAGGAHEIRRVLGIASFPFNIQNPEKVEEFETTRILRALKS
jgi:hypothetical protein